MHRGHVAMAEAVRREAKLDQVIFVPARIPPHKRERRLAREEDRLRMLELALAGRAGLSIDDRELRREGPSYTFDTVSELKRERPFDELYFLMGMDSVEILPSWYRIGELAQLCTFLVAARPGHDEAVLERARSRIEGLRIEFVATPTWEISSTEIRRALRGDEDLSDILAPEVLAYLREKRLYEA